MSEGPEIRRLAARLDRVLRGAELLRLETRLRKARAWLEEHPGALDGARFLAVESCGKHLVFRLDGDRWIHCHLLMFGKFQVFRAASEPAYDPSERARFVTTRAQLRLIRGQVLDLGFGDPYSALTALAQLGPDVLAEPFDETGLRARLLAPNRYASELGVILLDQTVANGVGNYLKSEILFQAALDPWRTVGSLRPDEVAALIESIVGVCRRAFETGGWTIPDAIGSPRRPPLASPRNVGRRHWVFRRTNHPCHRCGTPIRQERQGPPPGRITYFCPRCQHIAARAGAA